MQNSTTIAASPPQFSSAQFSTAYKVWFLVLLVAVYACSFLDRVVVAVLGQAIKADLGLTDFQIGLMGGLSFALLYTIAGIPLGRMAERRHRVGIISVCIVVWSAFAALCGVAQNFWQLVLFRAGVGIGEAGATPAAHSLIADHFPPNRRATALSIYALGVPIGVLISAFAGGWLAQTFGWRYTFIILGLPGVLLGVLAWLTLREPPRGLSENRTSVDEVPPLKAVIRRMWTSRTIRHMVIGTGVGAFALQGINLFIPMYLSRVFGMSLKEAGFSYGIIIGVAGFIGISMGGIVADWLSSRDQRWYAWVPGWTTLLAAPVAAYAFLQNQAIVATSAIFIFTVLALSWNGPTFSTVHRIVDGRMRASSTAIVLLVMSLIGHGLGPTVIGFVSDLYAAGAFTGEGVYKAVCTGAAKPAAGSDLAKACGAASAYGISSGMLTFTAILVWAAGHYLWASRTLRAEVGVPPSAHPSLAASLAEAED